MKTLARTNQPASPASHVKAPVIPAPDSSTGHPELSRIQSSLIGGSSLPASTRQRMEKSFSADFSNVRVHTGAAASSATGKLSAEAFANGRDIAFAPNKYRPGTKSGDHLIAHELAHVLQQRSGGGAVAQTKSTVISSTTDAAERAADAAADRVMSGKPAQLSLSGASTRGRIMRRARLGAAAKSPVVSAPVSGIGATKAGPAPVLTPVMTSTLSPAGGKLTDSAARKSAPAGSEPAKSKSPDEAQTAVAEAGDSPATVMVAGAAAGGQTKAETKQTKGKAGAEKKKEKKASDEKETKQEEDKKDAKEELADNKKKAKGKFGRVTGDRGAGAARAASQRLQQRSEAVSVHEGGAVRIGGARAAAAPPPNEAASRGQQQHADDMEQTEVPAGDEAAIRSNMRNVVAQNAPSSIEDLEDMSGPGGAGQRNAMSAAIASDVQGQTAAVNDTLSAVDSPPEGPASTPAVPQPEAMPAAESAAPDLAAAVPPPVNEGAVDASEFKEEADGALAEHDVDDETLAKSDEGPLKAIGDDKTSLNDKVDGAADRARSTESSARDGAAAELGNAESTGDSTMTQSRQGGQTVVSTEEETTRTGDETGRGTIADRINGIYQAASTEVNTKLSSLTETSVNSFRERQSARLEAFSSGVRSDLDALKRRRYSGAAGLYRRGRDWLRSINSVPEVKALYERHRNQYIADIDTMIGDIKTDIDTAIQECKDTLAQAKLDIATLVSDNEASMDDDARAALQQVEGQFQQMEQRIDQAAEAAKRALDNERQRAIDAMDQALNEIRAENAGLVDKIANAIQALADALGRFMQLMARITRMGIGAFLGSALSQAKDGVQNHLWEQLQEAFKQWLFNKLPVLQLLINFPPNWVEMLTALTTNLISLFTENLPALLPSIGVAAMIWLATTLAAKLIPGVGAIMAVIDGIRGAWALVQSLFSAAQAFFQFVMKVAEPAAGAAVSFAQALAHGIMAGVDAILTFLGVDRLIRRVVGAIARPFGRIINRITTRFRAFMARRRQRRGRRRERDRNQRQRDGGRDGSSNNSRRSARSQARRDRSASRRRRAQRDRNRGQERNRRGESAADRRRRRQQERQRRRAERLRRAVAFVTPRVQSMLRRGVPKILLRTRLALWRVRFRIRRLRADFANATLEAANSPTRVTNRWYRQNRREIFRRIRDLAERRYRQHPRRPQPEIGDQSESVGSRERGSHEDVDFAGHQRRIRSGSGEGNVIHGTRQGASGVGGETFGDLGSGVQQSGLSSQQVGQQMSAALSGEAVPNAGVADLAAISFGADVAQSRAGGGIAEVTARLGVAGLQGGTLTPEQAFGSSASEQSHTGARRAAAASRERNRSRTGSDRATASRSAIRREQRARRSTGGLVPQTMKGFTSGRDRAIGMTGGTPTRERSGAEARRQANEVINRTVQLVYQVVGGKAYTSVDKLMEDVVRIIEQVDRGLN
ncbi:MAG: DUF4157 domain-containing protein [bacterium]|nr:DUF4157 domain-containing protein [bacterium]